MPRHLAFIQLHALLLVARRRRFVRLRWRWFLVVLRLLLLLLVVAARLLLLLVLIVLLLLILLRVLLLLLILLLLIFLVLLLVFLLLRRRGRLLLRILFQALDLLLHFLEVRLGAFVVRIEPQSLFVVRLRIV